MDSKVLTNNVTGKARYYTSHNYATLRYAIYLVKNIKRGQNRIEDVIL